MLKEERWDKILEILDNETYISAEGLSHRLFVSLPTIRRDLSELQRQNRIIRNHGGAKKANTEHIVTPLDFRKTRNQAEKRLLCRAAAEYIHDNDIVFLDASTTVLQIADFLSDKQQITVITNGIPLALLLNKKGIRTYCTGGEIQTQSLGYAGSYAEEFIRNFNINLMIFSSFGVSKTGIIIDPSESETRLRRAALSCAEQSVFLCDHTKFQKTAPYHLIAVDRVDRIITDSETEISLLPNAAQGKLQIAR